LQYSLVDVIDVRKLKDNALTQSVLALRRFA
jgi:hypothetical protein